MTRARCQQISLGDTPQTMGVTNHEDQVSPLPRKDLTIRGRLKLDKRD